MQPLTARAYRSPRTPANIAATVIALVGLCQLGAIVIGLAQLGLPEQMVELPDIENPVSIWLAAQGVIAVLQAPVYIMAAVMFLLWTHRIYANLTALGVAEPRYTPGWAVAWWLIPIFNLFKPFQVTRNAWIDSDPTFGRGLNGVGRAAPEAPAYMTLWWAAWIIANVFGNITARILDPAEMEAAGTSGFLFAFTGLFWVIASALAIRVIMDITRRQELKSLSMIANVHTEEDYPSDI